MTYLRENSIAYIAFCGEESKKHFSELIAPDFVVGLKGYSEATFRNHNGAYFPRVGGGGGGGGQLGYMKTSERYFVDSPKQLAP